jgi:hypothetical protein
MGVLVSGSDARSAEVVPLDNLPKLAFDHDKIVGDALLLAERLGGMHQIKVE